MKKTNSSSAAAMMAGIYGITAGVSFARTVNKPYIPKVHANNGTWRFKQKWQDRSKYSPALCDKAHREGLTSRQYSIKYSV